MPLWLMTNPVHLLATSGSEDSLPKTLHRWAGVVCNTLITPIERTGTLWEGRYRATLIDRERYLLTSMRYD